mmetsp:Transcript_31085/g.95576  ORF Transcript_31085/g.95576 Transcript_31085/m.95576 type:complete len:126 (+) Transcript_31085:125-502(+)
MGQSSVCSCPGQKENEMAGFSPPASDVAMPMQEKAQGTRTGIPPQLERLKGVWRTDVDVQMMGEIVDGIIMWDEQFNHPQTPLRIGPSGQIEMDLMSTVHQAVFSEGPPAMLKWSDGETWIRVSK